MQTIWCVFYGIESLVIITANIIAITIFMKKKFLVSKSCYLIINLTVADVLVGVSTFVYMLEIQYANDNLATSCKGVFLNKLSTSVSIFTVTASLTALAMMAFERAMAILVPFRFRLMYSKHYLYAISVSWIISLLSFLRLYTCSNKIVHGLMQIHLMLVTVISILVIIISYAAIAIKRHLFPEMNINIALRNNWRLSKTLMLTTLLAIVAWVPSYIVLSLANIGEVSPNIASAMRMVLYGNSLANLLVYTARMPQFRREIYKIMRCCPDNIIHVQLCNRQTGYVVSSANIAFTS